MTIRTSAVPFEVKFAGSSDKGEFEGYGAFFGNPDAHGDIIAPGAFAASLANRALQRLPHVPMHLNHGDPELGGQRGIGVWQAMSEDSKGLAVRGRISGLNTDIGRNLYERVKDGAFSGLSIGYRVPAGGAVYGQGPGEPARHLKRIDLHEVSLVDTPSNPMARVHSTKSLGSRAELEDLLRKSGLARGAARKIAEAGWVALTGTQAVQRTEPDPAIHAALAALNSNLLDLKGLFR